MDLLSQLFNLQSFYVKKISKSNGNIVQNNIFVIRSIKIKKYFTKLMKAILNISLIGLNHWILCVWINHNMHLLAHLILLDILLDLYFSLCLITLEGRVQWIEFFPYSWLVHIFHYLVKLYHWKVLDFSCKDSSILKYL